MKITPLDIQKHEFPARRWGGCDPDEVRNFLQIVAEAYEEVVRDRQQLESELKRLKEELDGHREREKILKNTLLQAQAMSDEIRERAEKQASLMVKEAEIKAERLLAHAQVRASKAENSISELKILRNQLRHKLQATIGMVESVLKVQADEDAEDDKLRFLRKETPPLDEQSFK